MGRNSTLALIKSMDDLPLLGLKNPMLKLHGLYLLRFC